MKNFIVHLFSFTFDQQNICNMPHPLFKIPPSTQNTCAVPLGPQTCPVYEQTSKPNFLNDYVQSCLQKHQTTYGTGGYLEERAIYRQGSHFNAARCIHLGIDFWTEAGTTILAPWDAQVHSFAHIELPYDYGNAIVLQHHLPDGILHSLYGHLSDDSLEGLKIGMSIPAGTAFARLGTMKENGGWPAHLHFQLIRDMQGMKGNYVGVCTKEEIPFYRNNCPDPMEYLAFAQ